MLLGLALHWKRQADDARAQVAAAERALARGQQRCASSLRECRLTSMTQCLTPTDWQ